MNEVVMPDPDEGSDEELSGGDAESSNADASTGG